MQSLLILGRQPALGLAELESLYGAAALTRVGSKAVIVDVDPCLLAFDRLGGSVKFAKLLTVQDTASWGNVLSFLLKVSPDHSKMMPEGKMHLGLSALGLDISPQKLQAGALSLKKAIAKTGRSVRVVPNKTLELNSAQVQHNALTGPTGWELLLIRDGQKTIVAQTVKVQDIDAYARRDQGRPKRDSKVGMLPPKLAQIIINLAVGPLPTDKLESICDIPAGQPVPRKILDKTVLDPFCGTGVLLQEALLMGYRAYGTDLEQRMVDYSRSNLEWLGDDLEASNASPTSEDWRLGPGDATSFTWEPPVDFVAAEAYLGRPFNAMPDAQTLNEAVSDCNLIIKKFLRNIHGQLAPGTRLCIGVPAWQVRTGQFKHLPLLDSLEEIGYNRLSFEHAGAQDLIYRRDDQIVGRELLVLSRK